MKATFEPSAKSPWERHNSWMRDGDISVNVSATDNYVTLFIVHAVLNSSLRLTPDQAWALGSELLSCSSASQSERESEWAA